MSTPEDRDEPDEAPAERVEPASKPRRRRRRRMAQASEPVIPPEAMRLQPGETLAGRRRRLAELRVAIRKQQAVERVARREARAAEAATRKDGVAERREARKPTVRLGAAIGKALAAAGSVDAELEALVAGLDDRARDIVLRRWGYAEWPAPTLETLGERLGITRERTRQIEALHFGRLREIGPALPLASRAAALVAEAGDVLPHDAFRRRLAALGIGATEAGLRALPSLAEVGLVPAVTYHAASRLWLGPSYLDNPAAVAELEAALNTVVVRSRRALRRLGVIPVGRLEGALPVPMETAVAAVLGDRVWRIHSGYVVPAPAEESALTRECRIMLAVTPRLGLDAIRQRLRRLVPRPIRLPINVIAEALRQHPEFTVARGAIALREPTDRASLFLPSELAIIAAMEARGDYLTLQEMHAVLTSAGFNTSWMLSLAQASWLTKLGPSAYGLIGRPVPAAVAATAREDGRRSYEQVLVAGRHVEEAGRFHLRYRLTPTTIRGALRLPNRLTRALEGIEGDWPALTGVLSLEAHPGAADAGEETPSTTLSVRGGVLWDVSPWFEVAGAGVGEHVAVTVDVPGRRVLLARVDAEQAAPDEAAWRAEQADQAEGTAERRRLRWSGEAAKRRQLREERRAERQRRYDEHRTARDAARRERIAKRAEVAERLAQQRAEAEARRSKVQAQRERQLVERVGGGEDVAPRDADALEGVLPPLDWAHVRLVYVEDLDPVYGDALIALFTDFPLAPGTRGVTMGVIARIDVPRGRRKFLSGPVEAHLCARGRPCDPDEGLLLLPNLERVLAAQRAALSWREYRAPQLDLLAAPDRPEKSA